MALRILGKFLCRLFLPILQIFLTFLLILCIPFIIFCYIPYILYRFIVWVYVWIFRHDLLTLVSPLTSLLAQDATNYRPKGNYVLWILLKGDLSLEKFKNELSTRVINLRKTPKSKF